MASIFYVSFLPKQDIRNKAYRKLSDLKLPLLVCLILALKSLKMFESYEKYQYTEDWSRQTNY